MSWVIGACGQINGDLRQSIKDITSQPLHEIDNSNLFMLTGGNKQTCTIINDEKTKSRF